MLDTHSFDFFDTEQMVDVVEVEPSEYHRNKRQETTEEFLARRPVLTIECPHCHGKGRIPEMGDE